MRKRTLAGTLSSCCGRLLDHSGRNPALFERVNPNLIMMTIRLMEHIGNKADSQLLPAEMDAQLLDAIAGKLAKWRRGELVDSEERSDIELFSQQWAEKILADCEPGLQAKLYQGDTYVLAFLVVMSELDYLVQQEIVSRQLNYKTYEIQDLFDTERLRHLLPTYVRCFFRYNGLGPLAGENMLQAMSLSVHKFLESCKASPHSAGAQG